MPTYEFICDVCKKRCEVKQRYDAPPPLCPQGHGAMRRIFSPPAIFIKEYRDKPVQSLDASHGWGK